MLKKKHLKSDIEKNINAKIFIGASNKEERTEILHSWIKEQSDNVKLLYAINWRIAHSVFNVSCNFFHGKDIQNIDFYKIYKTNDRGLWEREK